MSDDLVVGRITFLDARAAEIVRLESALEAKDAEIERLKSGWHDCISDLTAAQKRAEQAERALAEAVEVMRPFVEGSVDISGAAVIIGYPNAGPAFTAASAFVAQHGSDNRGDVR